MIFEDNVNDIIGIITAILVFAGCWGGIIAVYGSQWGGFLGWIPAMGAAVAARYFWPLVWLAAGIAFILYGNVITPIVRQAYEHYFNAR